MNKEKQTTMIVDKDVRDDLMIFKIKAKAKNISNVIKMLLENYSLNIQGELKPLKDKAHASKEVL